MKPMAEKQANWWKEIRAKGFLSFIKVGMILVILSIPLFLFGRNLFYYEPSIYLWFLMIMSPSLFPTIGRILDWWRYEKKYQLYLKNLHS